jgi:membrane protein YdbS with pleckstrin-like domain
MKIGDGKDVRFEGEERQEVTLFVLRAHPITNLGWVLATSLVLILPGLVLAFLFFNKTVSVPVSATTVIFSILVWFLVILGVAFQQFVFWYFNIYILTNKRVVDIDFYGLFHRKVSQCTLNSVQDVTYTKAGILHNFLDFGDIHLQTAGTEVHFDFISIPDPEGSQHLILDIVAKYKRGLGKSSLVRPSKNITR